MSSTQDQAEQTLPKVPIPRPNAVLLKLFPVIGSPKFYDDMEAYFLPHIKEYLEANWTETFIKNTLVSRLHKDSQIERDDFTEESEEGVEVPLVMDGTHEPEEIRESIVRFASWKMSTYPDLHVHDPIYLLKLYVVNHGMKNGSLKGYVYPDVEAVKDWRFGKYFIKNFTVDPVADKQGQINFLMSTTLGDLKPSFNGHFKLPKDLAVDKDQYLSLVKMLRDEPQHILFLTDSRREALAAHEAGMIVLIVKRPGLSEDEGNAPDTEKDHPIPVISDLSQIEMIEDPSRPVPCC